MICFKDTTFCESDCANSLCPRFLSEYQELTAMQMGLPISMADFSTQCPDYVPEEPLDEIDMEDLL